MSTRHKCVQQMYLLPYIYESADIYFFGVLEVFDFIMNGEL
jgi:hypothetical protein